MGNMEFQLNCSRLYCCRFVVVFSPLRERVEHGLTLICAVTAQRSLLPNTIQV